MNIYVGADNTFYHVLCEILYKNAYSEKCSRNFSTFNATEADKKLPGCRA